MIIGGVKMAQTALGVGESTTMSVLVYDADKRLAIPGRKIPPDDRTSAISTPTAQTVLDRTRGTTWKC